MTDHEKRIGAFLDERGKMHGLCPEQIAGANESPLLVADLRALLADLDEARTSAAELLAFVSEYLEAWADGVAGDSYLRRQAEALIAKATQEQPK